MGVCRIRRRCDLNAARTRYPGIDDARTWRDHGVYNHDLVTIATLTDTN